MKIADVQKQAEKVFVWNEDIVFMAVKDLFFFIKSLQLRLRFHSDFYTHSLLPSIQQLAEVLFFLVCLIRLNLWVTAIKLKM